MSVSQRVELVSRRMLRSRSPIMSSRMSASQRWPACRPCARPRRSGGCRRCGRCPATRRTASSPSRNSSSMVKRSCGRALSTRASSSSDAGARARRRWRRRSGTRGTAWCRSGWRGRCARAASPGSVAIRLTILTGPIGVAASKGCSTALMPACASVRGDVPRGSWRWPAEPDGPRPDGRPAGAGAPGLRAVEGRRGLGGHGARRPTRAEQRPIRRAPRSPSPSMPAASALRPLAMPRSRAARRPCRSAAGRAIFCSGSSSISSHCASQPAVRGMAKSTGNISTGKPIAW